MKKLYLFMVLLLSVSVTQAQFIDDMEGYTDGVEILQDWWTSWSGGSADAIIASSTQALSGTLSGYVSDNGTTDGVLDCDNKAYGLWQLDFYMYIPSNREAYWTFQGQVPVGSGEWPVGNIFFNQDLANPGVGLIDDTALGAINFNFPHNEWFLVSCAWDMSAGMSTATWSMDVAGVNAIPEGTAYTDSIGTTATALGGINFFSVSFDNEYWIDDFALINNTIGFDDFASKEFTVYPNPFRDSLSIAANEAITTVEIFNVLGQQVISEEINALNHQMDTSHLSSGSYILKVTMGSNTNSMKLVK